MRSNLPGLLGLLARALGPLLVSALAGCGVQTADVRIGVPRPAREESCDLVVVNPSDPAVLMKYEQVGIVRMSNAPSGTGPLDPAVRDVVRPRACALGGEAISVLGSGDMVRGFSQQATASYIVWAKKGSGSAPRKF